MMKNKELYVGCEKSIMLSKVIGRMKPRRAFRTTTILVLGILTLMGTGAIAMAGYQLLSYSQPKSAPSTISQARSIETTQNDQLPEGIPPSTNNPASFTKVPGGYVPPICTTTVLHYKTIQQNVSYLKVGETRTYGGKDGYIKSCTADSNGFKPEDIKLDPYDQTVYIGTDTGTTSSQNIPSPAPVQKDYSICNQFGGSSAYDECIYAINHQ